MRHDANAGDQDREEPPRERVRVASRRHRVAVRREGREGRVRARRVARVRGRGFGRVLRVRRVKRFMLGTSTDDCLREWVPPRQPRLHVDHPDASKRAPRVGPRAAQSPRPPLQRGLLQPRHGRVDDLSHRVRLARRRERGVRVDLFLPAHERALLGRLRRGESAGNELNLI
eukprot:31063-Pelagococcus_subviridis.AAC.4